MAGDTVPSLATVWVANRRLNERVSDVAYQWRGDFSSDELNV
jgi:hypothetical protein